MKREEKGDFVITSSARVEGLLYVAGDTGLTVAQLVSVTGLSKGSISSTLKTLGRRCQLDVRSPFRIMNVNGRYQLITKRALRHDIQRYLKNTHTSILTSASLETLTIIAYNQPITRIEVDDVRGVNSSVTIEKLLRQRLIKKAGRKKTLGNPIMYRTTNAFLNLFGLKDLEQLPKLEK